MNSLLKIAMSSLVLGAALMGNTAGKAEQSKASAPADRAERHAAKFAAKAAAALKERDGAKAVPFAEEAVRFDPQNADHRATLGQAYLQAGRFASAATAFRDALILNPAHGRAALSLALADIAQGRGDAARDGLGRARGLVPDADYGLALALAGERDAAIAALEAAARAEGATAKTRQNLALAYALAGRWKESQVVAAQDVSADQLPVRMSSWAQFARSQEPGEQIASLLGVKPVADPGQPAQLALTVRVEEPVAVAAAVVAAPAPEAPVAEVAPDPASDPAPEMAEAKARAAESVFLATPAPAAQPAPVMRKADLPASKPVMQVSRPKAEMPSRPAKRGNFVVQLGAFSTAGRAEIAWGKINARSSRLASYAPSSMKFVSAGATFYRLSVGGFATRAEASKLCQQIKARGGECFVRGTAGDAPMQWASRAKGTKLASR